MTTEDEAGSGQVGGGRRQVSEVTSLDSLVGAHPDALAQIIGRPARPIRPSSATRPPAASSASRQPARSTC